MAMMSLDDLIEALLDEVAFRGHQGATFADYKTLVQKLYYNKDDGENEISSTSDTATAAADVKLQRKVWTWLTSHPDISVGPDGSGNKLSLDDIELELLKVQQLQSSAENDASSNTVAAHSNQESQQSTTPSGSLPAPQPSSVPPNKPTKSQQQANVQHDSRGPANAAPSTATDTGSAREANDKRFRLFAGQDRVWRALTGHDADWRMVPKLELDLLSIIASSGPKGILQNDLVVRSGQDKRSVPHRTDRLNTNGYIEKHRVLARSSHTSVCIHQRFSGQANKDPDAENPVDADAQEVFRDGMFFYVPLFRTIFSLLGDHDGVMTMEDMRKHLEIWGSRHKNRTFHRLVGRLEALGCLQRVRVKDVENPERRYNSLKLVREPTETDLRDFIAFGKKYDKENVGDDSLMSQSEEVDKLNEEDESNPTSRLPPQWTPEIPHANFLHDMIEKGGPRGFQDLRTNAIGPFWRRSLDISLGRLSDAWQLSQPEHIRYKAIIRDTLQTDKGSQFVYRTHPNFQKAVDADQASWEAVSSKKVGPTTYPQTAPAAGSNNDLELQELGFSRIPASDFSGIPGSSTLTECESHAKIPKLELLSHDPIIKDRGKSAVVVDWGPKGMSNESQLWDQNSVNAIASQTSDRTIRNRPARVFGGKPIGRPRKTGDPPGKKEVPKQRNSNKTTKTPNSKDSNDLSTEAPPAASLKRKKQDLGPVSGSEGRPLAKRPRTRSSAASHLTDTQVIRDVSVLRVDRDTVLKAVEGISQPQERPKRKRKATKALEEALAEDIPVPSVSNHSSNMSSTYVQINPPGYIRPRKRQRGRQPKSLVLIIKLESLRQGVSSAAPVSELVTHGATGRDEENLPGVIGLPESSTIQQDIHDQVEASNSVPRVSSPKRPLFEHTSQHSILSPNPEENQSPNASTGSHLGSGSQTAIFDLRNRPELIGEEVEQSTSTLAQTPPISVSSAWQSVNAPTLDTTAPPFLNNIAHESIDRLDVLPTFTNSSSEARRSEHAPSESVNNYPSATADPQNPEQSLPIDIDLGPVVPSAEERADSSKSLEAEETQGDMGANGTAIASASVEVGVATDSRRSLDDPLETIRGPRSHEEAFVSTASKTSRRKRRSWHRKQGVPVAGGFVNVARARMIMRIVEEAGGAFPDGNPLWFPFNTMLADEQKGAPPVDRLTIRRSAKNLVQEGRLHKITFAFRDKHGNVHTNAILVQPQLGPESLEAETLKNRMIDAHPQQYFPPGVRINPELMSARMSSYFNRQGEQGQETAQEIPLVDTVPTSETNNPNEQSENTASLQSNAPLEPGTPPHREENDTRPASKKTPRRQNNRAVETPKSHNRPSLNMRFKEDDSVMVNRIYKSTRIQKPAFEPVTPTITEDLESAISKETNVATELDLMSDETVSVGSASDGEDNEEVDDLAPAFRTRSRRPFKRSSDHSDNKLSSLRFENKGPKDFDPDYEKFVMLTLMDPRQIFHSQSGTFSTESIITGNARTQLWINMDAQKAFETEIPRDISEMALRGASLTRRPIVNQTPGERIRSELSYTMDWEQDFLSKCWDYLASGMRLRDLRFINHCLTPGESIENQGSVAIQWDNSACEYFTADMPPLYDTRGNAIRTLGPSSLFEFVPWQPTNPIPLFQQPQQNVTEFQWLDGLESESDIDLHQYQRNLPVCRDNPTLGSSRAHTFDKPVYNRLLPAQDVDTLANTWTRNSNDANLVSAPQYGMLVPPQKTRSAGRVRKTSSAKPLNRPAPTPKQNKAKVALDSTEKKTLLLAVAIVRSLTSGVDQEDIQWGLVAKACRYMHDGIMLRRCWEGFWKSTRAVANRVQDKFQLLFAQAYANNKFPSLDFDHLEDFDWAWLLDWARADHKSFVNTSPGGPLPLSDIPVADRQSLEHGHTVSEADTNGTLNERFFVHNVSSMYRDAIINKVNPHVPVQQINSDNHQHHAERMSEFEIARSWILADCLTPANRFDGQLAKQKLAMLQGGIVETALNSLLEQKLLRPLKSGRLLPGRNYEITDLFIQSFRRPIEVQHLRQAAEFKQQLDDAFTSLTDNDTTSSQSRPVPSLWVSRMAEDGQILAINNLVNNNQVEVSGRMPPLSSHRDPPGSNITRWGFTAMGDNPGYSTVHMDRRKLGFGIKISPTENYVFGDPLIDPLTEESRPPPPRPEPRADGKTPIPLWYDIHGGVLMGIWNMVLAAIFPILATRSGADVPALVACCKGNLQDWEVCLCLEWCEKVGIVRRLGDGWTAQEWWWLALMDSGVAG
ncbi:MAG: hypothetical protein M1820_003335 [Bogoriella megaspora]|nr:MAG: hypothetical protein M1820_003335 [Bogoriella megaspora]